MIVIIETAFADVEIKREVKPRTFVSIDASDYKTTSVVLQDYNLTTSELGENLLETKARRVQS